MRIEDLFREGSQVFAKSPLRSGGPAAGFLPEILKALQTSNPKRKMRFRRPVTPFFLASIARGRHDFPMRFRLMVGLFFFGGWLLAVRSLSANALEPVPLEQLRDRYLSPLGLSALKVRPNEWLHAETENFVYHYFKSHVAEQAAVEAEFYYRFVTKELGKEGAEWERKGHIFLFDTPSDWRAFQQAANLDPWTGGIHQRNELFVLRRADHKWKGHLLGHEVVHLVIDRFYGGGVPLWLNEGYAEYASRLAYASYYRARGYAAKPRSPGIDAAEYQPLDSFLNMQGYPSNPEAISAFYRQSERLVRFLAAMDKAAFLTFFDLLAQGRYMDRALREAFGSRFLTFAEFERQFREYASKDRE